MFDSLNKFIDFKYSLKFFLKKNNLNKKLRYSQFINKLPKYLQ